MLTTSPGAFDLLVERAVLRAGRLPPCRAMRALRKAALAIAALGGMTPERWAVLNHELEATRRRAADPGRN